MEDVKTLIRMIGQMRYVLSGKFKKQFVAMSVVILIGAFWEMLGVSAFLPFINALTNPDKLMEKRYIAFMADKWRLGGQEILIALCMGIALIYLIKNLYLLLAQYLQSVYKTEVLKGLSTLMLKSYLDRPYAFFTKTNSADILRGVTNDVQGVHNILELTMKLMTEMFAAALIIIYIVTSDALIAFSLFCIAALCFVLIVFGMKKKISEAGRIDRRASAETNKIALQAVSGIKDVFVFGKKEAFLQKYEKAYDGRCRAVRINDLMSACPEKIIETISIIGIMAVVTFRILAGIDDTFIAVLGVIAVAAFRLMPAVSRIMGYVNGIVFNREYLESAYVNIRSAREYGETLKKMSETGDAGSREALSFEQEISIENISWKYENQTGNVLDNLSLRIRKGDAIGIIGESGAGKSTFMDILLGLYFVQKGRICVDGKNIYENLSSWGGLICHVPQAVFLMDDTIRNNIVFEDEDIDDERIWNALEMASLKSFVEGLPMGLDTIVGERGVRFSGGQRQRIAIARALYRNPEILVLDEATASLDNETESAVMESIEYLQGKITLIIVAHRITTLRLCNHIYEIVNGGAVERRYHELIAESMEQ